MRRQNQCRTIAGFTMIELLVAMLVGSILATGIVAVFIHQTRAMALQEDLVDLEQNLRAAMGILSRDVRTAGLNLAAPAKAFTIGNLDLNGDGVLNNVDIDNDGVFDVVMSNNPTASDPSNLVFHPDALLLRYSHPDDSGIVINRHPSASNVNMQVCGPSGLAIGDILRVVSDDVPPQLRTLEITNFNPTCSDPICPNSNCDRIVFAPGPSDWNTAGGLGVNYQNGHVMLTTNIYYVGRDTADNQAMFRVSNYQTPHAIIAFGIIDFQVEYGVPGVDGLGRKVINYTSAPAAVQDVEMVKLSIRGQTRNPHAISSEADKRPKRTLTTEVQVRNLFY